MRAISRRMSPRSFASRFDSGSSNRNTLGWRTTARPIATRWRWPPDSALGRRSRYGVEPEAVGDRVDPRARSRTRGSVLDAQPERHVLEHAHVRVERVALEHHRDVALGRRQLRDVAAVDQDRAGGRLLEAGDHAQRRRLAAAARADEHDHLARRDRRGRGPGSRAGLALVDCLRMPRSSTSHTAARTSKPHAIAKYATRLASAQPASALPTADGLPQSVRRLRGFADN